MPGPDRGKRSDSGAQDGAQANDDSSFVQEYEPGVPQELFIYCRLCRRTIPVSFKPRRSSRLRCLCGHEARLGELDVFRTESAAQQHAAFYERVYQAAKAALRDAGVPLPPTGRFRLADVRAEGDAMLSSGPAEDESDIRSSYIEPSGESDVSPAAVQSGLAGFEARLEAARDIFARHEVLSELALWAWARRHRDARAMQRFHEACREDIALAPELIRQSRARLRGGERVLLRFTTFRHLAMALEEEGEIEQALAVVEQACGLGLKGYDERALELRARIEERRG